MKKFELPSQLMMREYNAIQPISATRVKSNGMELEHFSSTSYLAMNWNAGVQEYIGQMFADFHFSRLCSFGSNFLGGSHSSKIILEDKLSEYCGYETGIAFSSGWNANYSICEFMGKNFDLIISDCRNHNSVIVGLGSFREKVKVIDLNTITLEQLKFHSRNKRTVIFYSSVHGITGESVQPPMDDELRNSITLICDEAHTFGLIGETGISQPNQDNPDIRILGFSKAIGHTGSIVCTSYEIKEWLLQYASTYIYSTPLPPYVYDVNSMLFECMTRMPAERTKIFELADYFRGKLRSLNIHHSGNLHITGLIIPASLTSQELEMEFSNNGVYIKVSKYPSVDKKIMVARISFNPFHDKTAIDHFVNVIQNAVVKIPHYTE